MKHLLILSALAALSSPAYSKACHGANGKFVACPKAAAAAGPSMAVTKDAKGRCHGAGGKFVKCRAK